MLHRACGAPPWPPSCICTEGPLLIQLHKPAATAPGVPARSSARHLLPGAQPSFGPRNAAQGQHPDGIRQPARIGRGRNATMPSDGHQRAIRLRGIGASSSSTCCSRRRGRAPSRPLSHEPATDPAHEAAAEGHSFGRRGGGGAHRLVRSVAAVPDHQPPEARLAFGRRYRGSNSGSRLPTDSRCLGTR